MPCSVVIVGNKMRESAIINRLKYIGAKMSYFFRGLFLLFRTRRIRIRRSYLLLTFIGCCNLNGYVFYDCDRRQGFLCLSIRTVEDACLYKMRGRPQDSPCGGGDRSSVVRQGQTAFARQAFIKALSVTASRATSPGVSAYFACV